MSVIIGTYAGLAVIGFASGDMVLQVQASLIPVFEPAAVTKFSGDPSVMNFLDILKNPLFTLGLIAVLFYFFFEAMRSSSRCLSRSEFRRWWGAAETSSWTGPGVTAAAAAA